MEMALSGLVPFPTDMDDTTFVLLQCSLVFDVDPVLEHILCAMAVLTVALHHPPSWEALLFGAGSDMRMGVRWAALIRAAPVVPAVGMPCPICPLTPPSLRDHHPRRCPQAGLVALPGFVAGVAGLDSVDIIVRWTDSTPAMTRGSLRLGLALDDELLPLDLDLAVSWCGAVRRSPSVRFRAFARRLSEAFLACVTKLTVIPLHERWHMCLPYASIWPCASCPVMIATLACAFSPSAAEVPSPRCALLAGYMLSRSTESSADPLGGFSFSLVFPSQPVFPPPQCFFL